MSNYTIRRDHHDAACAIERDGQTVLQLIAGTELNERNAEAFVSEIAALRAQLAEQSARHTHEIADLGAVHAREVAELRVECERLTAEVNYLRELTSELWTRDACSEEDNRRLRAECEALREKAALWDWLALRQHIEVESGSRWVIRDTRTKPLIMCTSGPTLADAVRAAMERP